MCQTLFTIPWLLCREGAPACFQEFKLFPNGFKWTLVKLVIPVALFDAGDKWFQLFGLNAAGSGLYIVIFSSLTVWTADGSQHGEALSAWQGGWTIFYWAGWIAFAPSLVAVAILLFCWQSYFGSPAQRKAREQRQAVRRRVHKVAPDSYRMPSIAEDGASDENEATGERGRVSPSR